MSTVSRILANYASHGDFEHTRDALHALEPEAMREVLAAALDPARARVRDVCIMTLADALYPPALPHMRRWIEERDVEGVVLPAASALDRASGGRFGVDRLWSGDRTELPATLAALRAWWDAGEATVPTAEAWCAERRARRAALVASVPPPDPRLTPADDAALRPALIELVSAFGALDPSAQHRVELAAMDRVLPIYEAVLPDAEHVSQALDAVERFLDGRASEAELDTAGERMRALTERANEAAAWNAHHGRWGNPAAKAAGHVAQGVLYLCSAEARNRLQGLHNARDAITLAGKGFDAVRAELERQRADVEAAR